MSRKQMSVALLALSLSVFAVGCKKKTPAAAPTPVTKAPEPPPPPPSPAPTVRTFVVEPTSINLGQTANLRWAVENADTVAITGGIGTVQPSGSRAVNPTSTT